MADFVYVSTSSEVSTGNSLEVTFHRRNLPPPAVAFGSAEGRTLFTEAMAQGYMNAYFNLAEHFSTQGHPAFCGLGSLTMALNALFVDPGRVWKGVWRWFDESMLDCCDPLEVVKQKGITISKLACLARCNGAKVAVKYGDMVGLNEFREDVKRVCSQCPEHFRHSPASPATTKTADCVPCCPEDESSDNPHKAIVMIAAYSRTVLKQSGSGHFSPIGGYNAERDMVLIMDVARFKYPPHWVPLQELYEALKPIDPDTGRARGYMLLRATDYLYSKCQCISMEGGCVGGSNEIECTFVKSCCIEGITVVTKESPDHGSSEVAKLETISNSVVLPSAMSLHSIFAHKCDQCSLESECSHISTPYESHVP
jgi:hypothetical protein